jgi:hypothetical protein
MRSTIPFGVASNTEINRRQCQEVDNSNRESVSAIAGDRRDVFADLPRGHFGAILADPPWGIKTWSGDLIPKAWLRAALVAAIIETMEMSEIKRASG